MSDGAGKKPDVASIAGLLLAAAGVLGGLLLEGGSIRDIAQYTAAIVVIGGTVGATMLNVPLKTLLAAARQLEVVLFEQPHSPGEAIEQLIGYATQARKGGVTSLERVAATISDPFLRKALTLAVDGTDLQELRKMMELEIEIHEDRADAVARVFEQAGGYAPTVGIIGAVMGLIQVMKNLANIEEVGHGIAVSFVATVYGVGLANLFCLPVAGKIKARAAEEASMRVMMLEGVCGIVEGLNPKLLRLKLEAFAEPSAGEKPASS